MKHVLKTHTFIYLIFFFSLSCQDRKGENKKGTYTRDVRRMPAFVLGPCLVSIDSRYIKGCDDTFNLHLGKKIGNRLLPKQISADALYALLALNDTANLRVHFVEKNNNINLAFNLENPDTNLRNRIGAVYTLDSPGQVYANFKQDSIYFYEDNDPLYEVIKTHDGLGNVENTKSYCIDRNELNAFMLKAEAKARANSVKFDSISFRFSQVDISKKGYLNSKVQGRIEGKDKFLINFTKAVSDQGEDLTQEYNVSDLCPNNCPK